MADIKPEAQAAARRPAAAKAAQQQRDGTDSDSQPHGDPPGDGAAQEAHSAPGEVRVPEGVAWLVADEPLYIGDPEAAAAPVRAYNPGDQVAASQVDRYGWHDQTHVPEWASAPPAPAPDTSSSEEKT